MLHIKGSQTSIVFIYLLFYLKSALSFFFSQIGCCYTRRTISQKEYDSTFIHYNKVNVMDKSSSMGGTWLTPEMFPTTHNKATL